MTIIVPQWITLTFAAWGLACFLVQLGALARFIVHEVNAVDPGPHPAPPRKSQCIPPRPAPPAPPRPLCGCERCVTERIEAAMADNAPGMHFRGPGLEGWTYACGICGNKRCPHHADHRFLCTGSNDLDQVGVLTREEVQP